MSRGIGKATLCLSIVESMMRVSEKYSTVLAQLRDYLKLGFRAADFDQYVEEFIIYTYGSDPDYWPDGFDPGAPWEFIDTMSEAEINTFEQWTTISTSVQYDSYLPAYIIMNYVRLLPRNSWLVHMSDDAEDIANNGFKYGVTDWNQLGLSTHFSDAVRKSEPGINFAFSAEATKDSSLDLVGRNHLYGKEAIMFQSAAVLVAHHGDNEYQALFNGQDVDWVVYLGYDSYDEWQVMSNGTSNKEFFYHSPNLSDVIQWVRDNYSQYHKVIACHI